MPEIVVCKKALKRVRNPLPAPAGCPYCDGAVVLTENSAIYGRNYGRWPWCYLCTHCKAYIGCHPETDIPLGTLADQATRKARSAAHAAFDPLWKGEGAPMNRNGAYAWLAAMLGRKVEETHIGWFDAATCRRVVAVMQARKKPATRQF